MIKQSLLGLLFVCILTIPDEDFIRSFAGLEATPHSPSNTTKNQLFLITSLIWTGEPISDTTKKTYKNLRKVFPKLRIIHFVSPKYFIGDRTSQNKEFFEEAVMNQDNAGLFIAPWASILSKAGIQDKSSTTTSFWGSKPSPFNPDLGIDTFLDAYSSKEFTELLSTSIEIAIESDIIDPQISMISGWQRNNRMEAELAKANIAADFSAVNPYPLRKQLANYPIFQKLTKSWAHITPETNPSTIETREGSLANFPQNIGPIDYIDSDTTTSSIKRILRSQKNNSHSKTAHISIFASTMHNTLPRFSKILKETMNITKSQNVKLVSIVSPHLSRSVLH